MILLIDNYDSFSYNLYQMIGMTDPDITVIRNDEKTTDEIWQLNPSHIVISPGPGYPKDAGVCINVVKELKERFPIMGVCLGHQAICEAFGATITHAKKLMHGKQSTAVLDTSSLVFKDMPEEIEVARYHSLAASEETVPDCLKVIAKTKDGEIMGVCHRDYHVYGVQFHPESILTPQGKHIIENFLNIKKNKSER